jgi:hypothetical protein
MISDSLQEVFNQLKPLLESYADRISVTRENEKIYELTSKKECIINGRVFPSCYFAAIVKNKNYVTLHFFPAYTHPNEFADIDDQLKKIHKGKACFNITSLDTGILTNISQLLNSGYEFYKQGNII